MKPHILANERIPHRNHWEMILDCRFSIENSCLSPNTYLRRFNWMGAWAGQNMNNQNGWTFIVRRSVVSNLQLLKSTGQLCTSSGYNTKSISHLITIVALRCRPPFKQTQNETKMMKLLFLRRKMFCITLAHPKLSTNVLLRYSRKLEISSNSVSTFISRNCRMYRSGICGTHNFSYEINSI